jgi:hypothetical protein
MGMCFLGGLSSFAAAPLDVEWSAPVVIDTGDSAKRFVKTDSLVQYSPCFTDAAVDDQSYVVVRTVLYPETDFAVTSVVCRSEAGVEGTVSPGVSGTEVTSFRLIHSVYDAYGVEQGDPLVSDLVAGVSGMSTADALVDVRTNSLQLVAEGGGPAMLSYSTDWISDEVAAGVKISSVLDRYSKSTHVSSVTSLLMHTEGPVTADFRHLIMNGGGTVTLLCEFFDGDGNTVGDLYKASYRFQERWGMKVILK